MKIWQFSVNLLLVSLLLLTPVNVLAATMNYSPATASDAGTLIGRVPLTKLGSVEIPRGRVQFSKNNNVDITAIPEWQFDRVPILHGALINTQAQATGQSATITGLIYFLDGEWYSYVDNPSTADTIKTISGESLTGHIQSVNGDTVAIDLGQNNIKEISRASIKDIQSPRAYTFKMPATAFAPIQEGQPFQSESTNLSLQPTGIIFRLTALKKDPMLEGDGDWSDKKMWTVISALTAVQLLQIVPAIAVPLGSQHLRSILKQKEYATTVDSAYPVGPYAPVTNQFNTPLTPFTVPLAY